VTVVRRIAMPCITGGLLVAALLVAFEGLKAQDAGATASPDVARLAALARQWPAGAHIKVTLKDGTSYKAVLLEVKPTEIVVEPRHRGATSQVVPLAGVKALNRQGGVSPGRVAKYAVLTFLALIGVAVVGALATC
jgi:hypothetical protein